MTPRETRSSQASARRDKSFEFALPAPRTKFWPSKGWRTLCRAGAAQVREQPPSYYTVDSCGVSPQRVYDSARIFHSVSMWTIANYCATTTTTAMGHTTHGLMHIDRRAQIRGSNTVKFASSIFAFAPNCFSPERVFVSVCKCLSVCLASQIFTQ